MCQKVNTRKGKGKGKGKEQGKRTVGTHRSSLSIVIYGQGRASRKEYRLLMCNLLAHRQLNNDFTRLQELAKANNASSEQLSKVLAMMLTKCIQSAPQDIDHQVTQTSSV